MADYKIGSFSFLVSKCFFAKLPSGGEAVEMGVEGLYRIIAMIEAEQGIEAHSKSQAELREVIEKLAVLAKELAEANKLTFHMRDTRFLNAEISSVMFGDVIEEYSSEAELDQAIGWAEVKSPQLAVNRSAFLKLSSGITTSCLRWLLNLMTIGSCRFKAAPVPCSFSSACQMAKSRRMDRSAVKSSPARANFRISCGHHLRHRDFAATPLQVRHDRSRSADLSGYLRPRPADE